MGHLLPDNVPHLQQCHRDAHCHVDADPHSLADPDADGYPNGNADTHSEPDAVVAPCFAAIGVSRADPYACAHGDAMCQA